MWVKVRATFDLEGAQEGIEVVRFSPRTNVRPRALAARSRKHGVSRLAGIAVGKKVPPMFRLSVFSRCMMAQKLRRWYQGFGGKMRSALAEALNAYGADAEKWLRHVALRAVASRLGFVQSQ